MKIETIQQFNSAIKDALKIKKQILSLYYQEGNYKKPALIDQLKQFHNDLININNQNGLYTLALDEKREMQIDLSYEINEMKKDIYYLENGQEAFLDYLAGIHPGFNKQVQNGIKFLEDKYLKNFITDRDGTVNNYCGRYHTSIQSVYNAIFLVEFAKNVASNSIILTSAPLQNIGLADISITPPELFIYAASKGREFLNRGKRSQYPVEPHKQKKLDELNSKLSELVKKPEYEKYSLIGSGLQFKFGQTTIARQDVNKSVPEDESKAFMELIVQIVRDTDPDNEFFRIEDTSKDIEIILTIENAEGTGEAKDFDKGDGINFLDESLGLGIAAGGNLICGDTASDVPMAETAYKKSKDTCSIFVTKDDKLKQQVKKVGCDHLFVDTPDILITILMNMARY
jgi:hypothetical protein